MPERSCTPSSDRATFETRCAELPRPLVPAEVAVRQSMATTLAATRCQPALDVTVGCNLSFRRPVLVSVNWDHRVATIEQVSNRLAQGGLDD